MVATRRSSRITDNEKEKEKVASKRSTSVKKKNSRKSAVAKTSPSPCKVEKQRGTKQSGSLPVQNDTEATQKQKRAPHRSLSKGSTNSDLPIRKKPKGPQKQQVSSKEEEVDLQSDLVGKIAEAANDTAIKNSSSDLKPKEEESDQWEHFGNTSDEDAVAKSPVPPKKTKKQGKKKKASGMKPTSDEEGIVMRRSKRDIVRKDYASKKTNDDISPSSSSADDSNSGSVPDAAKSESESETDSEEKGSDSYDSDESFDFVPPKRKRDSQSGKKRGGAEQSGKRRNTNQSGSTGSRSSNEKSRNSSKTSTSLPRSYVNKPAKPWQRTSEGVIEGDVVVPPRALRKGEKKMLKFRIIAASLAIGRNYEMTLEEGSKIVEEMKAQSVAHQAAISSALDIQQDKANDNDSSSEDEWEDMEPVDLNESNAKGVEVTLKREEEKDWWAIYLRQEVNKCVRENWENAHKVNILCYIAHLQFLRKIMLEENLIPSLMLSIIPSGYRSLVGESLNVENIRRIAKWYHNTFKPSGGLVKYEVGTCGFDATARLSEMVSQQVFENDADRAALLFAIFVAMECTTRICLNTQPIPRKWDEDVINSIKNGKDAKLSHSQPKSRKQKCKEQSRKDSSGHSGYLGSVRDYWIEYWDKKQKRWICVDPLHGTVDEPNSIEDNLTKPVTYVFAIDNEGGVREITARYASEFLRPDFRRLRTDQKWIADTLKAKFIRANRERGELEDLHMRQELVNKPLPTTLSEYKNHPLYVLEKDLLKFEGIYPKPECQKPLGEVRGHKVYPRSTVYTLQSALNWIKMARSVKEGEKAYKVVKARSNPRIPAEQREQRYLDVFGFWQTEPFRPPKVENGRIPRNEFGNVYMYQPTMCPIGAVHLRLPGLPSIARRLGGLECVPAVVGWEFNSCSNFPIIEGACVLEKDAQLFIDEWKKLEATREERENKKREDRVLGNWRKLIRGILRLHYVKSKFGATKEKARTKKKKEKVEKLEENDSVIDKTIMAPRQVFTHDDLMKFIAVLFNVSLKAWLAEAVKIRNI
ncbi:hypothetical protein RB195_000370 [Necator americanus]|uniref:DNA repair protein Rad4 n=1 Tax=Necator americanus TaxID=51031 RepID=A0ABR1D9C4_NECAM